VSFQAILPKDSALVSKRVLRFFSPNLHNLIRPEVLRHLIRRIGAVNRGCHTWCRVRCPNKRGLRVFGQHVIPCGEVRGGPDNGNASRGRKKYAGNSDYVIGTGIYVFIHLRMGAWIEISWICSGYARCDQKTMPNRGVGEELSFGLLLPP
jgi:hypothetical protein